MANETGGYYVYDEFEGEAVHHYYREPFVVRAQLRETTSWGAIQWLTLAAFSTRAAAETWLAKNEADYRKGRDGCTDFKIENWNE